MDQALRGLPGARRLSKLSVLELGGTASLLSSLYHGMENILKQGLLALEVALPSGAAWHRDLLQSAHDQGIISTELRDRLVPYMAFRHFTSLRTPTALTSIHNGWRRWFGKSERSMPASRKRRSGLCGCRQPGGVGPNRLGDEYHEAGFPPAMAEITNRQQGAGLTRPFQAVDCEYALDAMASFPHNAWRDSQFA